jgi:hypothetical protein
MKFRKIAAVIGLLVLAGCGPARTVDRAPAAVVTSPAASAPASASPSPVFASPEAPVPSATVPVPRPAAVPKATAVAHPPRLAVHQAVCGTGYYRNSAGNCVHRPVAGPAAPAGATARCVDGTYSFSQHRQGTCSHHGGVAQWL